jgi:hypothetical protein
MQIIPEMKTKVEGFLPSPAHAGIIAVHLKVDIATQLA